MERQERFDLLRRRIAEIAFARDAHARGQTASEGFTDRLLCLAVTIAWGQVDKVDAGGNGGMNGCDALLERRLTPDHADTAAAQGERRDRWKLTEILLLHACRPARE
jgi:hypothetical protein